ncbi:hypothetical protein AB1Y20_021490 [Prymnesium parvum]|uniref:Uncharacterized protein n=1 Tax=Prymnesium parvum TaxID=97485 RepID=A0AB34JJY5_PRYPA|mmetsp:Transcript_970/g.2518  ORF Transcript_970/g.2518 Transcript_970/m.2518 type:complete len:418 (+) Transcript_970:139-1392(+)
MDDHGQWPVPPGPEAYAKKLVQGHLLTSAELDNLRRDAEVSYQLEMKDPNFVRASRKWRAQFAEDCMVEEARQRLVQKQKATERMVRRQTIQVERKREMREKRLQRGMAKREAVLKEQERQRRETEERLALSERRALVRETIQRALANQQRGASQAERVMFTHPSMLSDTPGPGMYEPAPEPTRAANFALHPSTEVRKRESCAPGPGSYDPKRHDHLGKEPGITFGLRTERRGGPGEASPGPAAYDYQPERKPGGVISRYAVKSDVERLMDQARETPGPGEYYIGTTLTSGRQSSITGRTAMPEDYMLERKKRSPGPGAYDLPPHRIRGGVIGETAAAQSFLPSINPGPGTYHQTPTVKQEQELRKLSKQVAELVKHRTALHSQSAPAANVSKLGQKNLDTLSTSNDFRSQSVTIME